MKSIRWSITRPTTARPTRSTWCSVPRCPSEDRTYKQNQLEGTTSYSFPTGDMARCRRWLVAIRNVNNDENNTSADDTQYLRVCSKHFTDEDYEKSDPGMAARMARGTHQEERGRRLRSTAVPSLFPSKTPYWSSTGTIGGGLEKRSHAADQCVAVDSRLQVKMNSPDSASDVSINQEAEDVSIKQEAEDVSIKQEAEDQPHLNILHVVVCKEEVSPEQERSPSLLQEEPEPLHTKDEQEELKEEQEELLQRPEHPAGSTLTLLAVKGEEENDDEEEEDDISSHCSEVEVELESDTDQRVHTGEKPFQCKHCDKSFSLSGNLKTHQYVHNGGKPFQCKLCDKSFKVSWTLKSHLRVHRREKPFPCKHCKKSYKLSSNLKSHLHVHTGEKPFHCKQCNTSFSHSSSLKTHQLVHTGGKPFQCKHCDESFKHSWDLKSHLRVHTGEKPFHCKHCKKSYKFSSTLKIHQLVHTEGKPFHCKHCKKSYKFPSSLKIHQLVHTGGKDVQRFK